jgi:hypothetical protein
VTSSRPRAGNSAGLTRADRPFGSFFMVPMEKADVQTLLPNGKMEGWTKPLIALLTLSDRD